MSEALLGVIIGGLLSGGGTWIALLFQQRKWHTELRIENLRNKRNHLEVVFQRVLDALPEAMAQGSYPILILSEIDFLLPEHISKACEDLIHEKDKTPKSLRNHYYTVARAMKKEISRIDSAIECLCSGKKT